MSMSLAKKLLLLVLPLLLLSGSSSGASTVVVSKEHTVYIRGAIQDDNILPLGEQLVKWALAKPGVELTIVLDSPGGELYTGFKFMKYLDVVHSQGSTIRCIVRDMAASLAFQILTKCDQRYALPNSLLLWHRVRTGGFLVTAPVAARILSILGRWDEELFAEVRGAMPLASEDVLRMHFEDETLHRAVELDRDIDSGFLTVLPYIPGLVEVDTLGLLTSQPPFSGWFNLVAPPADYIYAKPELVEQWVSQHILIGGNGGGTDGN